MSLKKNTIRGEVKEMKKIFFILSIVLIVILFLSNTGFTEEKSNFNARTGILWQTGNSAPNQGDFTIGGEYLIPGNYYKGGFSVTADYIAAKKADGNNETLVPVMANYKWQAVENFIFTAGIGLFASGGRNFGFQGIGTIPLNENWFIEGRYISRTNATGSPNSFYGFEAGYKF